jgi:hypothetical protein
VATTEFLSWFPKTIEFKKSSSVYCSDLSWWILAIGFIATAGFGLLPRSRPAVQFLLLVTWGFFYTRLVGQPSSQNYAGITINSYGEVMILLASSSLAYRIAASSTFRGWKVSSLKHRFVMWTMCYVLPYHVMINMNLIGYVPWLNIDLGGYEAVDANAGTYVVFTLLGIGAVALAFALLRSVYRSGRWKRLAMIYGCIATPVLLSWALFPSTSFHLHHTMLGALIIPITAFPTRAAAFSQATALGCFVQGYARWGWNSYLDTIRTCLPKWLLWRWPQLTHYLLCILHSYIHNDCSSRNWPECNGCDLVEGLCNVGATGVCCGVFSPAESRRGLPWSRHKCCHLEVGAKHNVFRRRSWGSKLGNRWPSWASIKLNDTQRVKKQTRSSTTLLGIPVGEGGGDVGF